MLAAHGVSGRAEAKRWTVTPRFKTFLHSLGVLERHPIIPMLQGGYLVIAVGEPFEMRSKISSSCDQVGAYRRSRELGRN